MSRPEGVPAAALVAALDDVEGARPATRLLAAIAHKHGVTQTELAGWFGVERRTVANWLARFEREPDALADAARDGCRPGRPPKLDGPGRRRLRDDLRRSPAAAGYDAPAWTPALVRRYVEAAFGVTYSRRNCRRLLDEATGPRG